MYSARGLRGQLEAAEKKLATLQQSGDGRGWSDKEQHEVQQIWHRVVILGLLLWKEDLPEGIPGQSAPLSRSVVKVINGGETDLPKAEDAIRQWLSRLNDISRITCFFDTNLGAACGLEKIVEDMFDTKKIPEVKVSHRLTQHTHCDCTPCVSPP